MNRPSVPLGEVTELRTGTRDPRSQPDRPFDYVDIGSVDNNRKCISEPRALLGTAAPSRARRIIRANDVIVSMTRPNLNAVALVPENLDGQICSTGFAVLRANGKVLPEYLFHFTTSSHFVRIASGAVSGAMYPAITEQFLRSIELPLPPIPEQRRIVDILNRANGIRRLRREALAKARQLIPALFVAMFGDPATNPRGWPIVPLAELLTFTTSGSRGWGKYYSDTGAQFVRVQNLTDNQLSLDDAAYVRPPAGAETRRTKIQPGDVLVAITGAPGLAAVAPEWIGDAYVNQHVAILRPRSEIVRSTYLWSFIANPLVGQRQLGVSAYGQTRAGLGFSEIRALKCLVPPVALQDDFAERLADIQATIAQQERMAEASEQLVAALMAQLFDGATERRAA